MEKPSTPPSPKKDTLLGRFLQYAKRGLATLEESETKKHYLVQFFDASSGKPLTDEKGILPPVPTSSETFVAAIGNVLRGEGYPLGADEVEALERRTDGALETPTTRGDANLLARRARDAVSDITAEEKMMRVLIPPLPDYVPDQWANQDAYGNPVPQKSSV